jgi:hypothetical protein
MKKLVLGGAIAVFAFALCASFTFAAAPNWDVTGNYVTVFNLGTDYAHDMSLTQDSLGNLSGNGGYPAGGTHTYGWAITSGSVSGDTIDFYADYNVGSDAVTPLTTMHATGAIATDGKMSGTWADNYQGGLREGTWSTTYGAANEIVADTSDSCPEGSSPVFLETKTVGSTLSTPVSSSNVLQNGSKYLLVSSGSWENRNDANQKADAEFDTMDNWATNMNGYDMGDYLLGEGEFDLQVDGSFINWGSYSSTHEYPYLYTGTGSPVNFVVFDGNSNTPQIEPSWYSDNSGSLTVDIYSCDSTQPTAGTISGMKYNDLNRNGQKDENEPGLEGWVIRLILDNDDATTKCDEDTVVATATTDADGNYTFQDVAPGTYKVRETHQKGWKRISKNPMDIVIAASSEVTGVDFGNAVKQKKEGEDCDKDDNRDEQSGHYYANHGRSDYGRDHNKKEHRSENRYYRGRNRRN